MRIGIDCRKILNPEKGESAGVGHYTYHLVLNLLQLDTQNEYVLFFDRSVRSKRIAKFKKPNTTIRYFPFSQYTRFLPERYTQYLISAMLEREKLDVFHATISELPKNYSGFSVITLHDLAEFKTPESFPRKDREELCRRTADALNKADRIITVSNATKDDLLYLFEIDPNRVQVIYHGVDKRFFETNSKEEIQRVKNKFKITDNYILYLGTIEPRKNILRLVRAFEELKKQHRADSDVTEKYQLVLAGGLGYGAKSKIQKIQQSEFKSDIIIPGYIKPDDIGALYQGASVFAFPSLYEGFGIPALEAMAKSVPVLASNLPSLPEIVSSAAYLVNPLEEKEIFKGLFKLITDQNLRGQLITAGIKRAHEFVWADTARQTLQVYKSRAL